MKAAPPLAGRRTFLRVGGLAGATLAAPALARSGPAPQHVLVLGAGMSGLTAALALLRRGHRVTVIEYQERVGGRVLSLPLPNGMVTEAGAGHFRGNMPWVLAYARHFGLSLIALDDGLPRYLVGGKVADAADLAGWPWPLYPEERRVSLSSTLNRYLGFYGLDTLSVLDPRWPGPEMLRRLSQLSLSELLRQAGASEAYLALLGAHAGPYTLASAALRIIPGLAYHFGDQNCYRIAGGNERLPRALAAAIGKERIVLGEPVTAIEQGGGQVVVTTRSGRVFRGDAAISTIPTSVLGDVAVRPAWSAAKARLFAETLWGNTVKIAVATRTPAWLARNLHGWPMAGGDRPWERAIDITGAQPSANGNLFLYLNGGNADAVLAMPDSERATRVLAQFRADMPDLIDEVLHAEAFAWPEQPWIRGSFGGPPLGGGWMLREWMRPEGRIHFAGDFTTVKTGWVEGAIESGLRAAMQIDPGVEPEAGPAFPRITA